MVKKIKIKRISAKKLYDILENELKYRIRELYLLTKERRDAFVCELEDIVEVQDLLDDKDVLGIKLKESYTTFILEIFFDRYGGELETKRIYCYDLESLENLDVDIDEDFIVSYK